MKKLQSLVLLLMVLLVPSATTAAYVQLADGVYQVDSTLYVTSSVTTLGPLQVNPSVVYSFATVPPACVESTFTGYGATLHMPAASYGAYFVADYWGNFANMYNDAVEPTSVTMSDDEVELIVGNVINLTANVLPNNASLRSVVWSSTNTAVAGVNGSGMVTALAAGECDIVATCLDKLAVCHVTVIAPAIYITLDKHEAKLLPNHSLTITPTMSPIATTLKVTVSNPEVAAARLMNGVVQVVGLAEGTTMIIVSAVDGQAVSDACMVTVYTELGDTNCDGYVNISDVSLLIDYLLGNDVGMFSPTNADTDKNGKVGISDVSMLIDALLGNVDLNPPVTETFTVNGVTFTMVTVEGGTFMMGATAEQGNDADDREKPVHQVTLSSYCIGQTEVTQALWQAVMGSNPSYFQGDLQRPVEQVSWDDCQTFITRLNELTGKAFRLPTEAEWEYAARGGNKSHGYKYAGSNDINEVAWYRDNSSMPVATKAPNELGLYDMSGNVWEWCQDWYGSYSSNAQSNPTGPASGSNRVIRGGCWGNYARLCRVSCRSYSGPGPSDAANGLGLRLAL